MASPVPYSPTQDVSPQDRDISAVHVDAPVAAFGGTVADAITRGGEVAQGAGKELFQRAYGFQELNEQMKADQASADTTDAQTQIYMKYDQKKGQERVDAFPQYVKDLEKARQDGASEVSSPYARQKYLDDTRRGQSQMVWHGGVLARQGQDEAANIAGNTQVAAAIRQFSTVSPDDKLGWDTAVAGIRQGVEAKIHLKGGPEPGTPEAAAAAIPEVSAGVAQLVLSKMNSAHPEQGKVLLQKARDDGIITPEDADRIQWKVDNAVDGKLGRSLGGQAGADSVGKNPKDVAAAARLAAEKADPGNKVLADNAEDSALARHDHEEALQTAAYRQTLQTLRRGVDGTDSNGKVPISIEEAMEDPNWRKSYNDAPPDVQGAVREQIRKNQNTDGWIANDKGNQDFNTLYATLKDPKSSAAEVDTALNTDIMKTQMTREQRFIIGNLQDQTVKNQSNTGSISSALSLPSVQLAIQSAGLVKGTQEYSDFVTAFTKSVEQYAEGAHHTVKDNEQLGNIANSMLMHQASSWLHPTTWGTNTDPMYKDPFAGNPGLKAQALKEYKTLYGRDPTEKELGAMSGMMYNKYFQQLGQQSRPAQGKSTNRVVLGQKAATQ